MQHTRVIVCKLGRLGELRKVVDTSAGQLQPDPGTEEGQTKNTGCLRYIVSERAPYFKNTNIFRRSLLYAIEVKK